MRELQLDRRSEAVEEGGDALHDLSERDVVGVQGSEAIIGTAAKSDSTSVSDKSCETGSEAHASDRPSPYPVPVPEFGAHR